MIKVIKKFGASWCTPCKFADKALEESVPPEIVLMKFDVDEVPDLAQKYGVKSLPVVVFEDEEGHEVDRITGTFVPQVVKIILDKHV